jgi:hypothetical protein
MIEGWNRRRRPIGEPALQMKEDRVMSNRNSDQPTTETVQKDPDEWVTGDETMTASQASYLKTLALEAGEQFDESLTKAEASKRIDELQERTGRGLDH